MTNSERLMLAHLRWNLLQLAHARLPAEASVQDLLISCDELNDFLLMPADMVSEEDDELFMMEAAGSA